MGNKALNLRLMAERGIRIPVTYVCGWGAYQRFLKKDAALSEALRNELRLRLNPEKFYAVRSSANLEDGLERSFAGQFKSVLNVCGVEQVLQSIWEIWDTTRSPALEAYLQRRGIPTHQILMAVIIQEMVQPVAAGVAFSRNPVTGADEVIVEAVCGIGEALVQSGVTPFRWVNKSGGWLSKPETEDIPLSLVERVVKETRSISLLFKTHFDLEWAWDGKVVYWLQARQITSLSQKNMYSNYMAKEMLPGLIKPLVWSVNIPMKSVVFVRFMTELLGETGIKPAELIRSFYYQVYFNMGVIGQAFVKLGLPANSVEMMTGVMPMGKKMIKPTVQMLLHLPRMMKFAHINWMFHRNMRLALPGLKMRVKSIARLAAGELSKQELLAAVDQLYPLVQEVAYFNILTPILSVMHNRMLERELKRLGIEPASFNLSEGITAELADFDPSTHLRKLKAMFEQLEPAQQESIRNAKYAQFMQYAGIERFQQDVTSFLERFGCLSDNGNDFSCKPWREDPDLVLRLILDFEPFHEQKTGKICFRDLKVNPLRRPMVKLFLERVRQYLFLREELSYLYTHAYGLFRVFYLALGEHFTRENILDSADDIFCLTDNQVRQIAAGDLLAIDYRGEVAAHKASLEQFRNINLPTIIYGDDAPLIVDASCQKMTGVATSPGHYTGLVKVVRGIQDFTKVEKGDVLVIPYSDVGWSPLFARAGAIVAESGGLLSHSSIIAREYGIPAVVSVNGAMNLEDFMRITVDGHNGQVVIHSA